MKVIDLLNKIANGEEVPNKIIGKNSMGKKEEYIYNDFWYIHIFENHDGEEDYYYMNRDIKNLNDEIEIIEEPKKIENIDLFILDEDMDLKILIAYLRDNNKLIKNKLNEIIGCINGDNNENS